MRYVFWLIAVACFFVAFLLAAGSTITHTNWEGAVALGLLALALGGAYHTWRPGP